MINRENLSDKISDDIILIDERNYKHRMETVVEPFLAKFMQNGYFERVKDQKIYFEQYTIQNATATVVVSHGFIETAEKYKEMVYYFTNHNFNVFILDHRGHGNSYRHVDNQDLIHVEDFNDYVMDLDYFVQNIVKANSSADKLYLFGHSMGGAISARYLQEYPTVFTKAVLNAPMMEIDAGKTPSFIGEMLAKIKVSMNKGEERIFIQNIFNKDEKFEDGPCTSQARYDYYFQKRLKLKKLQTNAATYNWVKQSLDVCKKIKLSENCNKIKTTILLFTAEHDTYVKPRGHNVFMAQIKVGEHIYVHGAKHEIYMSDNQTMARYLTKIFEFLD